MTLQPKSAKPTATDIGVIVGRFQTNDLHEGHIGLIETVTTKHPKVLIVLGLSPNGSTIQNPLDFEMRKQMILTKFPSVTVLYIKDMQSDELWSKKLNEIISDFRVGSQTATLYGSRDSFIKCYHGNYPVEELEAEVIISASEIRAEIGKVAKNSPEFRAGVIWGTQTRYPTSYQTVDVIIHDRSEQKILMGRKTNETLYRFPGGFVDPTDETLEHAARREAFEETKLTITDPKYIGSQRINDWRYRNEVDKIMTALFVADVLSGRAQASDDLAEIRWFTIDAFVHPQFCEQIFTGHRMLWRMYLQHNGIDTEHIKLA